VRELHHVSAAIPLVARAGDQPAQLQLVQDRVDLPAQELATTARVLRTILGRANAEVAAPAG
jgi:hypothetical protein